MSKEEIEKKIAELEGQLKTIEVNSSINQREVNMKELYAQYGEAMIKAEVLNAQINNLKRTIVEQMNKPTEVSVEPVKQ